jgi:hypothetical protein
MNGRSKRRKDPSAEIGHRLAIDMGLPRPQRIPFVPVSSKDPDPPN